jgi:hypothetical protein
MVTDFKRHLIISFSIILTAIVVATLAIYILSGNIAAQVMKVQTDRALVGQQTGSIDALSSLKEQEPKASIYELSIDQLLPTQDGLIGLTEWLNTIANNHEVAVKATFTGSTQPPVISPAADSIVATPGESNFSLEVSGPLSNIIAFLNDIETQSPGFLIEINSFDLTTSGAGYQLEAQGDAFFRP